jgi:hypothetical protein
VKSWNWLDNFLAPVLLVVVEAGWFTAWVSAFAHTARHDAIDLPYLAVAFTGVAAVLLTSRIQRHLADAWLQNVGVVAVALVGAGGTAGVLGALYLHAGFLAVSTHPWTITSQIPGDGAGLAWFVAAVAWLRGATLGRTELALAPALDSVVVATLSYTVFFLVGAFETHAHAFRAELGPAAVVLLVTFPLAMGVVALEHERDLERVALRSRRARPRPAWVAAVLVPMIAVAVVALGFAFVVGPLAPFVRRVTIIVVRVLAPALFAVVRAIGALFPRGKARHQLVIPRSGGGGLAKVTGHTPLWTLVVVASVAAIVLMVGLVFAVRLLLRLRLRFTRQRAHEDGLVEEERESIFSMGHVLDQLRQLWRRLLQRLPPGHRSERVVLHGSAAPPSDRARWTIRDAYRMVLRTARSSGMARTRSETAAEFETRLAEFTGAQGRGVIGELTAIYEPTRYGEVLDSPRDRRAALAAAEALARLLEQENGPPA